ncbi:MAG: hypothetical protein MHM6MM_002229 [Cercozoa sp. M6MM]
MDAMAATAWNPHAKVFAQVSLLNSVLVLRQFDKATMSRGQLMVNDIGIAASSTESSKNEQRSGKAEEKPRTVQPLKTTLLNVGTEPEQLWVGPNHIAVVDASRVRVFSLRTKRCVLERSSVSSIEAVALGETWVAVLTGGKLQCSQSENDSGDFVTSDFVYPTVSGQDAVINVSIVPQSQDDCVSETQRSLRECMVARFASGLMQLVSMRSAKVLREISTYKDGGTASKENASMWLSHDGRVAFTDTRKRLCVWDTLTHVNAVTVIEETWAADIVNVLFDVSGDFRGDDDDDSEDCMHVVCGDGTVHTVLLLRASHTLRDVAYEHVCSTAAPKHPHRRTSPRLNR